MANGTQGNSRKRESGRSSQTSGDTENQPSSETKPQISKIERNPPSNKTAMAGTMDKWVQDCPQTAENITKTERTTKPTHLQSTRQQTKIHRMDRQTQNGALFAESVPRTI